MPPVPAASRALSLYHITPLTTFDSLGLPRVFFPWYLHVTHPVESILPMDNDAPRWEHESFRTDGVSVFSFQNTERGRSWMDTLSGVLPFPWFFLTVCAGATGTHADRTDTDRDIYNVLQ
jgi:hypothetical protein